MAIRLRSVYADIYVKGSFRARQTPRVGRPMRPRVISWAGPAAFYQTRWSERDKWYKARIQYPELLPEMHVIEPADYYQTLAERLSDDRKDLSLNIGFRKPELKTAGSNEKNADLERLARRNERMFIMKSSDFLVVIDLDRVTEDPVGIALHFNIFADLFIQGAYFHSVQGLQVDYASCSVGTGNVVNSADTLTPPKVQIESGKDGYSTLLVVNLDGNCFESDENLESQRQIVQWLVGNVKDGDAVESVSPVVPYQQPTPYHGTGFHRIAFLLFRHKEPIDFSNFKHDFSALSDRLFSTNRFLKTFETQMTPSALKFCQMEWSESVDATLHNSGMKSPRFWYEWNEPLVDQQKDFPIKSVSFDQYLDQYRPTDVVDRQVKREWLEKRVHEGEIQASEFPDLFYAENKKKLPHWQHRQLMDRNQGRGIWGRLYSDPQNPAFQKDLAPHTSHSDKILASEA